MKCVLEMCDSRVLQLILCPDDQAEAIAREICEDCGIDFEGELSVDCSLSNYGVAIITPEEFNNATAYAEATKRRREEEGTEDEEGDSPIVGW